MKGPCHCHTKEINVLLISERAVAIHL